MLISTTKKCFGFPAVLLCFSDYKRPDSVLARGFAVLTALISLIMITYFDVSEIVLYSGIEELKSVTFNTANVDILLCGSLSRH